MAFGFFLGRQTESRLQEIADYHFPVSKLSHSAMASFKEQITFYENAIVYGDNNFVQLAELKSDKVQDALYSLLKLKGLNDQDRGIVTSMLNEVNGFTKIAQIEYTTIAKLLMSDEVEFDIINVHRQELLGKTTRLNQQSTDLLNKLSILTKTFSNELNTELTGIRRITKQQRYLNAVLFVGVVIVAIFLIAIIITRSISRPLERTFMLENALEQSADGIAVTDLDGSILFINKAWADIHGYLVSEILEKNMDMFYTKEQYSNDIEALNELTIEKGAHIGETFHLKKNGKQFPVLRAATLLKDERKSSMNLLVRVRDITQRKQMEEALQKANKELKLLASIDALTQVSNRRVFNEHLQNEWQRLKRMQKPLALIMSDIDHFKLYNDHYGHQAGDKCLQKVARVLKEAVHRPGDLVARYGGEEFALILPDTDAKGAEAIAEILLKKIRDCRIIHEKTPPDNIITISIGITSIIPQKVFSPEMLVEIADQALYDAKEHGRNRAVTKLADHLA